MYNALSIAHHIVSYSNQNGHGMSNLKLQKVLYFVQAEFLVSTPNHSPCFSDKIEAWDFGPVVPSVYHHYKIYGSSIIPSSSNDLLLPFYEHIQPEDEVLINAIVDATSNYSASRLVQITHNQSPWKNAYRHGFNNEISNKAILDFFKE